MSSEKRRRGRVQGGWASTSPSSSGSQSSQSRRPTTEKSLPAPAWTNKTVDVPKSHKFVYEEPAQRSFQGHQQDKEKVGTLITEKFVFFYRKQSIFSNFHPCNVWLENRMYCCTEQYYQSKKAEYFGDFLTRDKILRTKEPFKHYKLEQEVRHFDKTRWGQKGYDYEVMLEANMAKFSQNKILLDALLNTGDRILAEASPKDTYWGIGYSMDDPEALDEKNWNGQNHLGKLLMQVRDRLSIHCDSDKEKFRDLRQKLPVRTIDKPGIYDLDEAHSPSPPARVRLFYNFIDPRECEHIYHKLFNELPWKQKTNTRNGISYQEPRLTAWYGDHPYRYSGVLMPANTNWPPVVQMLRERLEVNTGCSFNSVLANLYRDGHDSVDWHSDDEPGLGYQPTIASLSFGDTRMFEFRKKPPPEEKGDYTYQQHVRIPLPAGSLVIMEGNIQETWQHRVPKEYHDRDARINLTYRVIYPE